MPKKETNSKRILVLAHTHSLRVFQHLDFKPRLIVIVVIIIVIVVVSTMSLVVFFRLFVFVFLMVEFVMAFTV